MVLSDVQRPADRLARLTFTAPHLATLERHGADESFALVLPGPTRVIRWYTIRAHRPSQAQIDVDIVLHGAGGPGSGWAQEARVGDRVGMRRGTAVYTPPPVGQSHLIVADETAAPAVGAIGDWLRRRGTLTPHVRALIEAPGRGHLAPLDSPFDVTVLCRGSAAPGDVITHVVRELTLDADMTAWVCGESAMASAVRRHLIATVGAPRRRVAFCGYWKLGQART